MSKILKNEAIKNPLVPRTSYYVAKWEDKYPSIWKKEGSKAQKIITLVKHKNITDEEFNIFVQQLLKPQNNGEQNRIKRVNV